MCRLLVGALCLAAIACGHAAPSPPPTEARETTGAAGEDAESASLIERADEWVDDEVLLLTAGKQHLAPSGDVHDYVSMPPYAWPNSTSPDGLPYELHDGEINPERDSYDKPKLEKLGKVVRALAHAREITGDAAYGEKALAWLRAWFVAPETRMNPNLTYAQYLPGSDRLRPTGIIDGRAFIDVVDGLRILEAHDVVPAHDQLALRAWLRELLDWLLTSPSGLRERAAKNNHGTWYDALVLTLADYLGDRKTVLQILADFGPRRLASQIARDGSQPLELGRTRVFHYAVFNLQAVFAVAQLGRRYGVDVYNFRTEDRVPLRAAVDWLIPYATCQQAFHYQQLDDVKPQEFRKILEQAARVWGDAHYAPAARALCVPLKK